MRRRSTLGHLPLWPALSRSRIARCSYAPKHSARTEPLALRCLHACRGAERIRNGGCCCPLPPQQRLGHPLSRPPGTSSQRRGRTRQLLPLAVVFAEWRRERLLWRRTPLSWRQKTFTHGVGLLNRTPHRLRHRRMVQLERARLFARAHIPRTGLPVWHLHGLLAAVRGLCDVACVPRWPVAP